MPTALPLINKKYHLFKSLSNANLICATSTRHSGNMSLVYGQTKDVLRNRKDFLGQLGIDYQDLVCAKQAHKSNVKYIKETDLGKGALVYGSSIPDTDAFITDKKNIPLAIFSADCLSIFLYDAKTPAMGLAHAGWQGTEQNIATRTVQLMQEKFNTPAHNLYISFGPAIRSCCYKVGEEFKDLIKLNKIQLLDSGVDERNIFDCKICTSCQNLDFFSYRKESNSCGRMMSVMLLR